MLLAAAETVQKKQLDPFHHVMDAPYIEIFDSIHWVIPLPKIGGFQVTKFHVFLALSAVLVAVAMLWLGNKMRSGDTPKGRLWNLIEALVYFVRNKIAIPSLGEHDANKYTPFLVSLFLFIFLCNLFGMIPFMPSPTAHIYVTAALALVSFAVIHVSGVAEHGFSGYLKTFIPHIHLEGGAKYMALVLIPGMAILEYMTAFIRATVLAVRLFANMLAGHMVLFVILFFIKLVADPVYSIPIAKDWMYWPMALFSTLLVTALSLLELFIAGLQAFIFTFLTAIFIGLAKHPPH